MKRNRFWQSKGGFFTLMGLLLTLAIIGAIWYMADAYSRKPSVDKETEKLLLEQDINTSSRQTTLDSIRKKIQGINRKVLNREKEIESMR
ncbi:MAG: hypothetical protein NG712_06085 [Omnitrophica bacterium]|nr:hypothetical protein [Candidatus Omnitrophota bacterium]